MRSIFPATIDGDLLKLVHLSNGFRMVGGQAIASQRRVLFRGSHRLCH
jgi:hypothetical protein